MYGMLVTYCLALKTVRAAIPSLVPILGQQLRFSKGEQAMLLSSFFQGYVLTIVPAATVTQRLGGKTMLTVCLGGSAVVIALLPTAAGSFGALGCQALFVALGLVQGGFPPGLSALNAGWIPDEGHEKVWAVRGQTLAGDALCQMLAAVATPFLARGGHWARACFGFAASCAVVTVLWHLVASDPPAARPAAIKPGSGSGSASGVEWSILKLPQVWTFICVWVCQCAIGQVAITSLAPSMFIERFGLTSLQAGKYIAAGFAVNVPGMFLTGLVDSALIARGVSRLAIRRGMTLAATIGTSASHVGYVLAQTPAQATAMMLTFSLAHQCSSSSYFANVYELGGPDSAALTAFGAPLLPCALVPGPDPPLTAANASGQLFSVLLPPVAFFLRRRSGSWVPVFMLSAAAIAASGALYRATMTLTPARELLRLRKQAGR